MRPPVPYGRLKPTEEKTPDTPPNGGKTSGGSEAATRVLEHTPQNPANFGQNEALPFCRYIFTPDRRKTEEKASDRPEGQTAKTPAPEVLPEEKKDPEADGCRINRINGTLKKEPREILRISRLFRVFGF